MSLKRYENRVDLFHWISQSPSTPVLVVEGPNDKIFWSRFLDDNVFIYHSGGKPELKRLSDKFPHPFITFVYDRDFEDEIPDSRAVPYPSTDLEAFLFTTVGLSFISEKCWDETEAEIYYRYICEAAARVGQYKRFNQVMKLGVSFKDFKWLFDRIKKSKCNKLRDLEEFIADSIGNFNNNPEWDSFRIQPHSEEFSGKDCLFILATFRKEVREGEFERASTVGIARDRYEEYFPDLVRISQAGSVEIDEFVSLVRERLSEKLCQA